MLEAAKPGPSPLSVVLGLHSLGHQSHSLLTLNTTYLLWAPDCTCVPSNHELQSLPPFGRPRGISDEHGSEPLTVPTPDGSSSAFSWPFMRNSSIPAVAQAKHLKTSFASTLFLIHHVQATSKSWHPIFKSRLYFPPPPPSPGWAKS